MGIWDYVILGGLAALVGLILFLLRKKGVSACGCCSGDCSACGGHCKK